MLSVLLIDDDERIQAALSTRLRASGMEVRQSFNGATGVKAVQDRVPDAIVMDIRMPGIDGIEACRQIRAFTPASQTPVIFLSAESCPGTRDSAMQAGGDCFLQKPFESREVVNKIRELADHGPVGPGTLTSDGD